MSIHDKCKNVILFHNNLIKFLRTLKSTVPEVSEQISGATAYYKSKPRTDYIRETHDLLDPHMNYISQNDIGIFSDDYAVGPRVLLPHLDFRHICDIVQKSESGEDMEAIMIKIFKHLQTLYVSSNVALTQIGVFDRNLEKQKEHLMNMLENLRVDEEVRKRIDELKNEEKSSGGLNMEKLGELLGEDNFVFNLAKDIASEMDIGNDDVSDPVEAITSLFANNGRKFTELMMSVEAKLEKKIESGEIDRDVMMKDAKKVGEKLRGVGIDIGGILKNSGITDRVLEAYSALPEDERERNAHIGQILEKGVGDWTEEEKTQVENFSSSYMSEPEVKEEPIKRSDVRKGRGRGGRPRK